MIGAIQADSVRVATAMYSASLLSLVPLTLAAVAAFALRGADAATRVWVWRTTVLVLLLVLVGRASPSLWTAWILPSAISAPLVALGRAQIGTAGAAEAPGSFVLALAISAYCCGVLVAAVPLLLEVIRLSVVRRRAAAAGDAAVLSHAISVACARIQLRRPPRVYVSTEIAVPITWGWIRPVVLMPSVARTWSETDVELALSHEFVHVRNSDWLFGMIAHLACAAFWFNPGTWWLSRQLAADRELACDASVLAAGADRGDYAGLLMRVADGAGSARPVASRCRASALVSRGCLRARLSAILHPVGARRSARNPRWYAWSVALLLVAAPATTLRLAPTRSVLDSLMRDTQWQTRVFAVAGLAQRSDSLAVARAAAERDPNPQVRAAARRAVAVALSR